jgi:hypothetical protein
MLVLAAWCKCGNLGETHNQIAHEYLKHCYRFDWFSE